MTARDDGLAARGLQNDEFAKRTFQGAPDSL
ncbi:hypothetical protein J2W59_003083 [Pseudomonas fluorescens]|nr:hypothetical protein [Pseudomonas fluorescens]